MKLLGRNISPNERPLYIAEISGNHDGTEESIIAHMAAAWNAGADAIKLQTFYAHEMTPNNGYIIKDGLWKGKNLYDLYNSKSITGIVANIFDYANGANIPIFSSVFGFKGLELLERLNCPAYKISSFENNWKELIGECINTGKPVLVSMGAGADIRDFEKFDDNFIPLHCVSSYPAKLANSNLWNLELWPNRLGDSGIFGYSDHTIGTKAAEYATILGARIIEKHFALDYQSLDGYFSATPEGFKNLVRNCNAAFEAMVWDGTHAGQEFKRSLYAAKDIPAGKWIEKEDLAVLRPALGMSPNYLDDVARICTATQDIKAGEPITKDILTWQRAVKYAK